MGVPGLTSLIDQNPHLLSDFKLHDIHVVIDGNNLYYFLYYYFKIRHHFGGDYDTFAHCTRFFFENLRSCGVTPHVIFDGVDDKNDKKLKTVLQRKKDRIAAADSISTGGCGQILPVLAYDTFRTVLMEMEIDHVTSDFEADEESAALANELNCPVMSNDSDFYVFDVRGGFILFNYLNLEVEEQMADPSQGQQGYKFMNVKIYFLDSLLNCFPGINRELIPLFATLSGNDFIESSIFDDFYASAKLPKASSKASSKYHSKMVSLLMWLQDHETVELAVKQVLQHSPERKHDRMRELIYQSVESYRIKNSHMKAFLESPNSLSTCVTSWKTFGGNPLPEWFVKEARHGLQALRSVNVLCNHRTLLQCQVEKMSEPSSHMCSVPIRKAIYGILLSLDTPADTVSNKNKKRSAYVEEYDRLVKDLVVLQTMPTFTLLSGRDIPTLEDIPNMDLEERRLVLLDVLGTPTMGLQNLPEEMKLYAAVIVYWVREANPKVTLVHLYSLLMCMIKLGVLDTIALDSDLELPQQTPEMGFVVKRTLKSPGQSAENAEDSAIPTIQQLFNTTDKRNLKNAWDNLSKFMEPHEHHNVAEFDTNIIHTFCQFQSCFEGALHLTMVLQSPLSQPKPSRTLNGTFFYEMCKLLKQMSTPLSYCFELLTRSSPLAQYLQDLLDVLLRLIPSDSFYTAPPRRKKTKKKEKKNKADLTQSGTDSMACGGADGDGKIVEQSGTTIAACSLGNRFEGLSLEK